MSKDLKENNQTDLASRVEADMQKRYTERMVAENNLSMTTNNAIQYLTSQFFYASPERRKKLEADNYTIQTQFRKQIFMIGKDELSRNLFLAIQGLLEFSFHNRNDEMVQGYSDKIKQLIGNGANVNLNCTDNFTPLLAAASIGDADLMVFLIEANANVSATTEFKQNVIHMAAQNADSFSIICALKARNREMEATQGRNDLLIQPDNKGRTPLQYMIVNPYFRESLLEVMMMDQSLLLLEQAKQERKNVSLTPIHALQSIADQQHNVRAKKVIDEYLVNTVKLGANIELGLNIYKVTNLATIKNSRKSPTDLESKMMDESLEDAVANLMDYCLSGDTETSLTLSLSFILNVMCGFVDSATVKNLDTSQYMGTMNIMRDVALILIAEGADVNAKSKSSGFSLLHLSVYFAQSDVFQQLMLEEAIDSNTVSSAGDNLLHLSVLQKDPKMLDLVHSVNPSLLNQKRDDGNTPLHLAVNSASPGPINSLIAKKVALHIPNNNGNTALHFAALNAGKKGFSKILYNLLKLPNTDALNVVNKEGKTALHYTAAAGSEASTKYLLEAGCDDNIVDKTGKTAFECAVGEAKKVLSPSPAYIQKEEKKKIEEEQKKIEEEQKKIEEEQKKIEEEQKKIEEKQKEIDEKCKEKQRKIEFDLSHLQSEANKRSFKSKAAQAKDIFENLMKQPEFSVHKVTTQNWTPLHIATKFGNSDIANAFIAKGADVNAKTKDGVSVLRCAIDSKDRNMVKIILKNSSLAFEHVVQEIAHVVQGNSANHMFLEILKEKVITDHFKAIGEEEKQKLAEFCNRLPAKGTDYSKVIKEFSEAIHPSKQEGNEMKEPVTLSKKALAKQRKAQANEQKALEKKKIKDEKRAKYLKSIAKQDEEHSDIKEEGAASKTDITTVCEKKETSHEAKDSELLPQQKEGEVQELKKTSAKRKRKKVAKEKKLDQKKIQDEGSLDRQEEGDVFKSDITSCEKKAVTIIEDPTIEVENEGWMVDINELEAIVNNQRMSEPDFFAEEADQETVISDLTNNDFSSFESEDSLEESKFAAMVKPSPSKAESSAYTSLETLQSSKEFTLEERRQQIKEGLADNKDINGVSDLPECMQAGIHNLLDNGCLVLLKGSKVKERKRPMRTHSQRLSVDYDVEIVGKRFIRKDVMLSTGEVVPEGEKVTEAKNAKARQLLEANFNVTPGSEKIFRGFSVPDFVVNAKDDTGLIDISLYDVHSPSRFSWIHSKEKKIFFNPKDKTANLITPIGLKNYIQGQYNIGYVNNGFYVNPEMTDGKALKGLALRLSFLETVGRITTNEFNHVIFPKNPVDILFEDLKMHQPEYSANPNKKAYLHHSLNSFMDSHHLDKRDQNHFLMNLSNMTHKGLLYNTERPKECYDMLQTVIKELRSALYQKQKPLSVVASSDQQVSKLFETTPIRRVK